MTTLETDMFVKLEAAEITGGRHHWRAWTVRVKSVTWTRNGNGKRFEVGLADGTRLEVDGIHADFVKYVLGGADTVKGLRDDARARYAAARELRD